MNLQPDRLAPLSAQERADLKITDMRFCDIDGMPKRCTLIKLYTNAGIVGYGEVRDAATGAVYGTVRDITHPAASDVYAIQTPQGETVLFPAVAEFLGELCPQEGYVTVRPIPGMFDGGEVRTDAD